MRRRVGHGGGGRMPPIRHCRRRHRPIVRVVAHVSAQCGWRQVGVGVEVGVDVGVPAAPGSSVDARPSALVGRRRRWSSRLPSPCEWRRVAVPVGVSVGVRDGVAARRAARRGGRRVGRAVAAARTTSRAVEHGARCSPPRHTASRSRANSEPRRHKTPSPEQLLHAQHIALGSARNEPAARSGCRRESARHRPCSTTPHSHASTRADRASATSPIATAGPPLNFFRDDGDRVQRCAAAVKPIGRQIRCPCRCPGSARSGAAGSSATRRPPAGARRRPARRCRR